ncbi:DUF3883 domain-containing protein [Leptospira sp. 201903075]|uniref:DUF3883 domain-containing protein n=1 Tax=Leptospira chreensis TaxID=2810035 RepID=UPI00196335F3|nr:DUF3883 domain-containing protein [Leptospira chreensis]MBM9590154.1 DUF3883 domain-containing protein [Leptospira chreensis]
MSSLIEHCQSISIGWIVDYEEIILYCQNGRLLTIIDNIVSLTNLGQQFVYANKEEYLELTNEQKNIIVEQIVFNGSWEHESRIFFSSFKVNLNLGTYELSFEENPLQARFNKILKVFIFLEIVEINQFYVRVFPKFSLTISNLISRDKTITEEELENILSEKKRLGSAAENAVVEFEKNRLLNLGKKLQAELVRKISSLNVAEGYDIESFNGNSENIIPDRFIEVKATKSDKFRFYWSVNEMKVATQKRDSYFLYLIKNFNENKISVISPLILQNPINIFEKFPEVKIEATTFLVENIDKIPMYKFMNDQFQWYQIS